MAHTRLSQRPPLRVVRALGVLAVGVVIIVLNLPRDVLGESLGDVVSEVSGKLKTVSFVQSWKMYAPNPQRAQSYMNLTAHYDDGTSEPLWETEQERHGWNTHFAWNKTREDIWRHYANFRPKQSSDNRRWYLWGVCVREARKGKTPKKIVMEQVTRGFTSPKKVRKGAPGLGRPRKQLITVTYCRSKRVKKIIEADIARREG